VPLEYTLSDLPAQSVGAASTLSLAAFYDGGGVQPDGAARVVQVNTPSLYVTLDSSGTSATFRDSAAEARLNSSAVPPAQRFASARIYDEPTHQFVDTATRPRAPGDATPPIIAVSEGRPGLSGPPGRAKALPAGAQP
jgi:hypothetical protein